MFFDFNYICFVCKIIKNKIFLFVFVLYIKFILVFIGFNVFVFVLVGIWLVVIFVVLFVIVLICCCNFFFYNIILCKLNISRKRKYFKSFYGLNYMYFFKKKKRNV